VKKDDFNGLLELYDSLSPDDIFYRFMSFHKISPEEISFLINDKNHVTIVAEIDGKVVGEASLFGDGEIAVVVHPQYRNRGIGTKLVKSLIDLGKSLGMTTFKFFTLPDNIPMIKIGRKLGFDIKIKEDEVVAVLRLDERS
jgi:RimJ/RimL family protein N-acetyltransferase